MVASCQHSTNAAFCLILTFNTLCSPHPESSGLIDYYIAAACVFLVFALIVIIDMSKVEVQERRLRPIYGTITKTTIYYSSSPFPLMLHFQTSSISIFMPKPSHKPLSL